MPPALGKPTGEKLGEHEGGFKPFNSEITNRVREKDDFPVVQVDHRRLREGIPTLNTDWWNQGVLTHRVLLVEVPETFIRSYHVQLARGALERVAGWIRLDGPHGPVRPCGWRLRRPGSSARVEVR